MNKGRKEIIQNYNKIFEQNKLKTKIFIIEGSKDYIDYEDYLVYVSQSLAILDIVNENVDGLTLRCMEALFFSKKLITNNKAIKTYDFYNSDNIFILGEDNLEDISLFIRKPYKKLDKDILEYYDFESWLKRFER